MPTNEFNIAPSGAAETFATVVDDPLIFVGVQPPGLARKWYATVDLPHGSNYYGGWKEDRLLSVSPVRRTLAGSNLEYAIGTFKVEFSDEDYRIRTMIADTNARHYTRWEFDVFMASPSGMRTAQTAARLATGLVDTDPDFDSRQRAMSVEFTVRDRIGVAMGWTSVGQSNLPRRTLSQTTLPGVTADADGKGAWLPWGRLTNGLVVPSGLTAPVPSGSTSAGSVYNGGTATPWSAGFAPWNAGTISPASGLSVTTVAGGDCAVRDHAVQVFPVNTNGDVGDPVPFVMGSANVVTVSSNRTIRASWLASPQAVKYYVLLAENYFGWRPSQYIETSGLTVDFNHSFDLPDPGTGFATGGHELPSGPGQPVYYSARSWNGLFKSDWSTAEEIGATVTLPGNRVRPIRTFWSQPSATRYQVRRRGVQGGVYLLFDVPSGNSVGGMMYWDDPLTDVGAVAEGQELRPAGRVKALYTRDQLLQDGNIWHEFLVAGAAIAGVDDWYYDPGAPSSVEINSNDGTDFLVPKAGTAWDNFFSTRYRDILGSDGVVRRYTLAYARNTRGNLIASGVATLSFNLRGIESAGDGSGTLLEDLHDQAKHLLTYFVVASGEGYTSGLYGAAPVQGYESLPVVHTASFDAVKAMRQTEISGGLVGAGITGANGELVPVSTELKRWMVSGDWRFGPNRDWQIRAAAINNDIRPSGISTVITAEFDIQTRTFRPQPRMAELQNVFSYRYRPDYVAGGWSVDKQSYVDAASVSGWAVRKGGEDLEFHYLAEAGYAAFVLEKHRLRHTNAPMYALFEGGLAFHGPSYDIGEYVKVSHYRGVANGGWDQAMMWIVGHQFDPATKRVELECMLAHGDSHLDTHADSPAENTHTDVAHVDTAHVDTAHGDTAHSDATHGDVNHHDNAHQDTSHSDVAHVDDAHVDTPHGDTDHGDVEHQDHDDQFDEPTHMDVEHQDTPHDDTGHGDSGHGDTSHADVAHDDVAHDDVAHTDSAHGDVAHVDTAHVDTAHVDTHGDLHGDTPHADAHGDDHNDI